MNTSGPATLVAQQDNSVGEVLDESIVCPDCRYCLRGLPRRSACPECGLRFEWSPPNIELAVEKFTSAFPRWIRPLIKPRSTKLRKTRWSLLYATLMAGFSSAFLVYAQLVTVWLTMVVVSSKLRLLGGIRVAEYGTITVFYPARLNYSGAWEVATIALAGQMIVIFAFLVFLIVVATRHGVQRVNFRRLCGYSMIVAPMATLIPMTAIALWQIANVTVVRGGMPIELPMFFDMLPRWHISPGWVRRVGFAVLVISVAMTTIYTYRAIRSGMRGADSALRAVKRLRSVSPETRSIQERENQIKLC